MILGDRLSVGADLTGGTAQCVELTDNGVKKLLVQLSKNDIKVEIRLSPAAAADFAAELQDVLDWLSEAAP